MYKMNLKVRTGLWLVMLLALIPLGDEVRASREPAAGLSAAGTIHYESKGRRDPFVQPQAGRLRNVLEKVEIENLRLTGVIRNPKQTLALFVSQSGPKFGYLLKMDKLYRENFQAVAGITGRVVGPQKVLLQQGENEIVYQLRGTAEKRAE